MGSYAFNLKTDEKIIDVMVEGLFTPQNATNFISDYQKCIAKINPTQHTLAFDATKLKVSTQEMLPMLEGCLQMYKEAGFCKIVVNAGSSAVLKMQLRRVVSKVGLQNCEIL